MGDDPSLERAIRLAAKCIKAPSRADVQENPARRSEMMVLLSTWRRLRCNASGKAASIAMVPDDVLDLFMNLLATLGCEFGADFGCVRVDFKSVFSCGMPSSGQSVAPELLVHVSLDSCAPVVALLASAAKDKLDFLSMDMDDVRFASYGVESLRSSIKVSGNIMAQSSYNTSLNHVRALVDYFAVGGARLLRLQGPVDTLFKSSALAGQHAAIEASILEIHRRFLASNMTDLVSVDHTTRLTRRILLRLVSFVGAVSESMSGLIVNMHEDASFKGSFYGTSFSLVPHLLTACVLPFAVIPESRLLGHVFGPARIVDEFPGILSSARGETEDTGGLVFNQLIKMGFPNRCSAPEVCNFKPKIRRCPPDKCSSSTRITRDIASLRGSFLHKKTNSKPQTSHGSPLNDTVPSRMQHRTQINHQPVASTPGGKIQLNIFEDTFASSVTAETAEYPQFGSTGTMISGKYNALIYYATKRERTAKWRSNRICVLGRKRAHLKALLDADAKQWANSVRELMGNNTTLSTASQLDSQTTQHNVCNYASGDVNEPSFKETAKLVIRDTSTTRATNSITKNPPLQAKQLATNPVRHEYSKLSCRAILSLPESANASSSCSLSTGQALGEGSSQHKHVSVKTLMQSYDPPACTPYHKPARISTERSFNRQIRSVQDAPESISFDLELRFLERCFILWGRVLGEDPWQIESSSTVFADHHFRRQRYQVFMDHVGLTQAEGAHRAFLKSLDSNQGANAACIMELKCGHSQPIDVILKEIHAYSYLHARFLQSNYARILLQHERDRPIRLNTRASCAKSRKSECFRHEIRFVVNSLNLFDRFCMEHAWQYLLKDFDVCDSKILRSQNLNFANLSNNCALNDSTLAMKLNKVLQFAVDAKDTASRDINPTRTEFFAIIHDVILELEASKDPGGARADLLGKLRCAFA